MKKIAGLVVILAALVLGGYYIMGVVTERTIKNDIAIINQSNGLFAEIVEYKRGWFCSTASLNWRLNVPQKLIKTANGQPETQPAQEYQLQMPLKVSHGPIIFSSAGIKFGLGFAQTDLNLPAIYIEQFNNLFTSASTKPKLDLSLFVNYFNTSEINMDVPHFTLIAKQNNAKFDWKGMKSSMIANSSLEKIDGDFTVAGINFSKDNMSADVGEVSGEYKLHKTKASLYLGDARMVFPSLIVKDGANKIFELNDFDLYSSSNIENGLFHSHLKASLQKIDAQNKLYGPGSLEVTIRNLDAEVLARVNDQANKAQQGSDLEKQQALIAILPELPKLFSRGAEFEISEMNFALPEGTVEGNVMVILPKGDINNPFELMQKIQGDGKLKMPAAVLKQIISQSIKQKIIAQVATQAVSQPDAEGKAIIIPADMSAQATVQTEQKINDLIQSGVLVVQGNDYLVSVKLAQGQLLINGKPFNPAMMNFY